MGAIPRAEPCLHCAVLDGELLFVQKATPTYLHHFRRAKVVPKSSTSELFKRSQSGSSVSTRITSPRGPMYTVYMPGPFVSPLYHSPQSQNRRTNAVAPHIRATSYFEARAASKARQSSFPPSPSALPLVVG